MPNRTATSLGRLRLENPVTVASGTFGPEYGSFYNLNELGALVTKTVTLFPKQGNKPPRLLETEAGLLNSIGLQNPGVEAFLANELAYYQEYENPLLVSFSGATEDEFAKTLEILDRDQRIAGYEVNVSCPNVENEGIAFGTDAVIVEKLTSKLRKLTQKELIVKLTPNVTDIATIAKAAENGGADAVALINTMLGMAIDYRTGKSVFKRGVAGYSGKAIKPIALQMVHQVYRRINIPILAMGGIATWQDALEFIYAGAAAVAVGTSMFINPQAPQIIVEGLTTFLTNKGCSIEEIKGKVWGIED